MTIEHQIQTILSNNFQPVKLEIKNNSYLHKNHKEYREDSHYSIIITSKLFDEKNRIERHQMIYEALQELMKTKIHALQIKAYSINEYNKIKNQ